MAVRLNPYINFRNSARAALTFYQSVFGGEFTISTFGELGMTHDPAEADNVMHGQLETSNGMVLMCSDVPSSMPLSEGSTISVSLSGDDEPTLRGYWDKLLGEGGQALAPFEKAPWGDTFGMVTDKFGVTWLVNAMTPKS